MSIYPGTKAATIAAMDSDTSRTAAASRMLAALQDRVPPDGGSRAPHKAVASGDRLVTDIVEHLAKGATNRQRTGGKAPN